MKSIEHLRNFGSYAKGQVSAWPDAVADDLINRSLAKTYVEPEPVKAPVRAGVMARAVRKVAKPKKG